MKSCYPFCEISDEFANCKYKAYKCKECSTGHLAKSCKKKDKNDNVITFFINIINGIDDGF